MQEHYDFQRNAISALENGDHVLVSAPTSSGKTRIAEHLLQQKRTSVIYTAPTKALCNQKFIDFSDLYYDIGLLTGDREINENALHLVVTTEILLKMLVLNDTRIGEAGYYVFDEFHFIGDLNRGHVWEECILKCPQNTRMLFLSATIPNVAEICEWLKTCTNQPVRLICETHRPVPLEMCLYQRNGTRAEMDQRVYLARHETGRRRSDWIQLVQWLKKEELTPAIVFVFNRWSCHEHANYIRSINFLTDAQRSYVNRKIQNIPMIDSLRESLLQGVGVHHSGLTTEIREVVELLTSKGVLRCIFATETLAIGLNMPTRTVVFESLTKHEGFARLLTPAEFAQLIGRAGRKGFDTKGTVVFPWWISSLDIDQLLFKELPRITSQLQITPQLILHHDEEILHRSFRAFSQKILITGETCTATPDQLELFDLSKYLPYYKFPKNLLSKKKFRAARFGLCAQGGYVDLFSPVKCFHFLAFADSKHKPISLKKYLIQTKTLWYLENENRIYALMAKRPGPQIVNISQIALSKRRKDNFLVQEFFEWADTESILMEHKIVQGGACYAAARAFYAVDPIEAVEFITSKKFSQCSPMELLYFLTNSLECKNITATQLIDCVETSTNEVAREYEIFEGDLISAIMRIKNLISEYQMAVTLLVGEKSEALTKLAISLLGVVKMKG